MGNSRQKSEYEDCPDSTPLGVSAKAVRVLADENKTLKVIKNYH